MQSIYHQRAGKTLVSFTWEDFAHFNTCSTFKPLPVWRQFVCITPSWLTIHKGRVAPESWPWASVGGQGWPRGANLPAPREYRTGLYPRMLGTPASLPEQCRGGGGARANYLTAPCSACEQSVRQPFVPRFRSRESYSIVATGRIYMSKSAGSEHWSEPRLFIIYRIKQNRYFKPFLMFPWIKWSFIRFNRWSNSELYRTHFAPEIGISWGPLVGQPDQTYRTTFHCIQTEYTSEDRMLR